MMLEKLPLSSGRNRRRQRGFALAELLAALGIVGVVILMFTQWQNMQMRQMKLRQTGDHFRVFRQAAETYIKNNFTSVYGLSASPNSAAVTPAILATAGYLPPGYVATNNFGQSYQVIVRRPAVNQLEAVAVSVGGTAMSALDTSRAVLGAGDSYTGYVVPAGDPTACSYTPCGRGPARGWEWDLAPYAPSGVTITSGHLVGQVYSSNSSVQSKWLSRVNTENPNDNQMETSIDMGNNALNNVSALQLGTETLQQPQAAMINDFYYNGRYTGNQGDLTLRTVSLGAVALSGAGCSPNGKMGAAVDGSGKILICKNSSWQTFGGTSNCNSGTVKATVLVYNPNPSGTSHTAPLNGVAHSLTTTSTNYVSHEPCTFAISSTYKCNDGSWEYVSRSVSEISGWGYGGPGCSYSIIEVKVQ